MLSPASRLALVLLLVPATIETDPVRKGVIRALVEAPAGQSVPRELSVRVRPSLELVGQENLTWEKVVSCPIRNGEWTCEIPTGRLDLRFTGAAVRPVYRWGVVVQAGRTVDLGRLRLWRGATISGFVRPEGKIPQYSVQVDLLPLRVGGSKPLRTMTLESTSRPWGFFRFEGIPPGEYGILVRDLNLPVLGAGPFVVDGDRPVELPKPLVLRRLSLSVEITPPKDPQGEPWLVTLGSSMYVATSLLRTPKGQTDERGHLTFRDLAPGDYGLEVFSQEPRGANTSWGGKKIRLDAITTVRMKIPYVQLIGEVLYREQPLQSSVTFYGEASGFFSFEANERGLFEGYVRGEESWKVQVSSRDPEILINLQDPVRMPKESSSWRMAIRVPDTVLTATVVDPRGRLVSPALIQALGEIPNYFRQNDSLPPPWPRDIIGLKPGPQKLRAAQNDPFRQGDQVEVQLREGEKNPLLRLVLPDVIDIRGRVLPYVGSAAGTRVYAWATAPSAQANGVGAAADEDGDFRLILPGGTQTVNFVVLPPGSSLRLLQSEVSEKRRLEIPVRRAGGTLVVEGPAALVEIPKPKDSEPPRISTAILLRKWADLQATPQSPGRLVVPNVEPGTYTLCSGDPFTLRRGPLKEGETRCVSGILKAAGELTLRIPVEAGGRIEWEPDASAPRRKEWESLI